MWESVLLVIHLMVTVVMIGVVLLQRSEGGALGIGGGGGGGGGFGSLMTGRSAASALTKTTAVLALAFFLTSIGLSLIGGGGSDSLLDRLDSGTIGEGPLELPSGLLDDGAGTGDAPSIPVPTGPTVPDSQ